MNMPVNIDVTISVVPPQMVPLVWDKAEPLIQRGAERAPDDISIDKTYNKLITGSQLLILITKGTEVIAVNVLDTKTTDAGVKYLFIHITAGDELESWVAQFLEVAKAIAKEYGCKKIRGTGRPGWARKLKQYGWEASHQTVECEV